MSDMTIPEYDVMVLKEQHREAERRHERAINRWKQTAIAVGYLAIAAAVVGVAFIWWRAFAGPSAKQQIEDRQKVACIAQHGTWIRVGGSSHDGGDRTCLFAAIEQQGSAQ